MFGYRPIRDAPTYRRAAKFSLPLNSTGAGKTSSGLV
jgi:hypothetical protein